MRVQDILQLILVIGLAVALVVVVRLRRKSHGKYQQQLALDVTCEHLRPVLQTLLDRGHVVRRVGQLGPDMPMEVHLQPPFDPAALYAELKPAEPVLLSERNVVYCRECWCELHPIK